MKAGILRELCDDALSKSPIKETKDAISSFLIELSEAPIQLKTKYEKEFTVSYQGNTTFSVMPKSSGSRTPYPVSIGDVRTALDSGVVGDAYNRAYVQPIADEIRRRHPATASAVTEVTDFVLVIDEINRGNVPAILGEVITLLEPDKRLGAEEELTVVLPGSRHRFGIPANLHVVGTMNTSDRSVEALDIALRRRFEFVEMPPNSSVLDKLGCEVEGLKMSSLLEAINSRLEVLRDREHLIGHAPFVNVRTLEALRNAFRHGIIPLLQEYFYSDWGKIGAVLGKGFVTERSRKATLKPGFDADDITDDAVWDLTSDWSLDTFRSILD
jgi:5-methylcytosine-specific restriction protein B